LNSALEISENLDHKRMDQESAGRGHFGGGIALAWLNSQDSGNRGSLGNPLHHKNNLRTGSQGNLDFSILPKILQSVTLHQWMSASAG